MGLGFDGPGGATAAMGSAVVRTGIMVRVGGGGEGGDGLKQPSVGSGRKGPTPGCVDRCCRPRSGI